MFRRVAWWFGRVDERGKGREIRTSAWDKTESWKQKRPVFVVWSWFSESLGKFIGVDLVLDANWTMGLIFHFSVSWIDHYPSSTVWSRCYQFIKCAAALTFSLTNESALKLLPVFVVHGLDRSHFWHPTCNFVPMPIWNPSDERRDTPSRKSSTQYNLPQESTQPRQTHFSSPNCSRIKSMEGLLDSHKSIRDTYSPPFPMAFSSWRWA